MIRVTFTYQEKLQTNEWGTDRLVSRIINGHEFKTSSPETNLPGWLQSAIRRKFIERDITLVYDPIGEVCGEFVESQNRYPVNKFYLSQPVEVTMRTKNEDIYYYVKPPQQ